MTRRQRNIIYAGLLAAIVALVAVASFGGGGYETDVERIQRLNNSFACPLCNGESVAQSNAAVSANIRQFIDQEVRSGATDQEIRDELLVAYDVQVLLNPPADGFAGLVWVLPVVVGALAAVLAAAAMTRTSHVERRAGEDDQRLVAQARELVER